MIIGFSCGRYACSRTLHGSATFIVVVHVRRRSSTRSESYAFLMSTYGSTVMFRTEAYAGVVSDRLPDKRAGKCGTACEAVCSD